MTWRGGGGEREEGEEEEEGRRGRGSGACTAQLSVVQRSNQHAVPTYAISFSLMTMLRSGKMDGRFSKMADCKCRQQTAYQTVPGEKFCKFYR